MKSLFGGIYRDARVLVTGHTGFKGSWLCLWLDALGAKVAGLALAPETSPAHWPLLRLNTVEDLRVDLRNAAAVADAIDQMRPDVVFHLAAQPLVRRSYQQPRLTFETNVMGLLNLLEAVRATGSVKALVNATTDKVYRQADDASTPFREEDPLGGHDPYSSSKACAELLSDCYRKSFFDPAAGQVPLLATARAGNVIGGGDWSEDRLVPDLVAAAVRDEPLKLRNPFAIRPWQHVLEPLSGYLRLGQALLEGNLNATGAWNFGPCEDANLSVHALATQMQAHWPGLEVATSPGPHPHEAQVLRLHCGKAAAALDWHPIWDAGTTLERTVSWYRHFHEAGVVRSSEDLDRYVDDARRARSGWAA